jgi:hypothetical protein
LAGWLVFSLPGMVRSWSVSRSCRPSGTPAAAVRSRCSRGPRLTVKSERRARGTIPRLPARPPRQLCADSLAPRSESGLTRSAARIGTADHVATPAAQLAPPPSRVPRFHSFQGGRPAMATVWARPNWSVMPTKDSQNIAARRWRGARRSARRWRSCCPGVRDRLGNEVIDDLLADQRRKIKFEGQVGPMRPKCAVIALVARVRQRAPAAAVSEPPSAPPPRAPRVTNLLGRPRRPRAGARSRRP